MGLLKVNEMDNVRNAEDPDENKTYMCLNKYDLHPLCRIIHNCHAGVKVVT